MNDEQKEINKSDKKLNDTLQEDIKNSKIASFEDISFVPSNEDGEELSTKDIVKKLRDDIKRLKKDNEEYLTGWQRAKADYINLQKEMDQSRNYITNLTKEKMVDKLIPGIDSFELAFQDKDNWEKVDEVWRVGIVSIYKQIISALKSSGVERIEDNNVIFNPVFHESIKVTKTKDESKDHLIDEIFQVGYKIGDKAVRPAKVSIFEFEN